MPITHGTGEGLTTLFTELRLRESRYGPWEHAHPGAAGAGEVGQGDAGGMSVTMPLHAREGLTINVLATGVMLSAGTASGDERWAGMVAARGRLVMLDTGRISTQGVRMPFMPLDSDHREAAVRVRVSDVMAAELLRGAFAAAAESPQDDPEDVPGEPPLAMEHVARSMTDVAAAVPVARPTVPELTGEPLENVRRLFALTVGQLGDLFGVTERQAHRYLREGLPENRRSLANALTAAGLTVIGGLGAHGAQRWLFSGAPTAAQLAASGQIDELRERAEALRDSPAT